MECLPEILQMWCQVIRQNSLGLQVSVCSSFRKLQRRDKGMNQQQIAQNKLQEHDGGRALHGSWKHVQVVQLVILHSPWSCA